MYKFLDRKLLDERNVSPWSSHHLLHGRHCLTKYLSQWKKLSSEEYNFIEEFGMEKRVALMPEQ
jgi:hypothetical protein